MRAHACSQLRLRCIVGHRLAHGGCSLMHCSSALCDMQKEKRKVTRAAESAGDDIGKNVEDAKEWIKTWKEKEQGISA